jgi:hypothetical protein
LAIFVLGFPALLNGCGSIFARDWMPLGAPPSGVKTITWVRDVEVWVEANNGELFMTSVYPDCEPEPDCQVWLQVDELPIDPDDIDPNDPFTPVRGTECGGLQPGNPAPNPSGDVLECAFILRPAGETFEYFYFALMSDGNIMYLNNTPIGIPWICY